MGLLGADAAAQPRRLPPFVRGLRAAVALLTRVPVGGFPYSEDDWRWSAAYLPAIGACIGIASAGAWRATERAGPLPAAVVAVAASLLVTGAMHEDGLADTADALGGGSTVSRERILAILKDSRIGVYGSAALTVTILLRVALLERLGLLAPMALILCAGASRLVPVWLIAAVPYVTAPDVAKSRSITAARWPQLVVATASVVLGSLAAIGIGITTPGEMATVWLGLLTVAFVCGARFTARAGGITGDFLGAAQQLAECAILLTLAISRGK
jgi:adenosylcobinamide-GDP ribazoletransferase